MTDKGVFFFDPEDAIYADHFPGNPVVPGTLIVHAFMVALKAHGQNIPEYSIERFRFKNFLSPGEYMYDIHVHSGQATCRLYQSGEIIVTGKINL